MGQKSTNLIDKNLESEFYLNFASHHTRISYRNDWNEFCDFLAHHYPTINSIEMIKRAHIIHFRNELNDHGRAPKSQARKLAGLSSIFDFLIEKGLLEQNPCSSVKRPRQMVQTETLDLSDGLVLVLFEKINPLKGEYLLHKAVIYLLFTTGIRRSELIGLRLKNIKKEPNLNSYYIEIRGKGGKYLRKLLHPTCSEILFSYLDFLKGKFGELHPEDWVFRPSKNPLCAGDLNKPLNPKSVHYIVKLWCRKAGIDARISPHSARATYIGSAIENGQDIYQVSRDVGHSSVKTTEGYNKRRQNIADSPVYSLGFLGNLGKKEGLDP